MTEFLLWQFELCLLFVFWRSPENFVSSPGCPCHAGRLLRLSVYPLSFLLLGSDGNYFYCFELNVS